MVAKLDAAKRKALPEKDFALPSKRSKSGGKGGYPIEDKGHAKSALSRIEQHGTPSEKRTVERKVKAKFPDMQISRKPGENKYGRERRLDNWAKGD